MDDLYKGIILARSDETSGLSSPEIELGGETVTMTEGSICMKVDSTNSWILYDDTWYSIQ